MAERPKEMDDFLCEPRVGRFGSVNADGSPHVVPFVFLFDPKEGTFFVSTKAASVTTRNLRRNSSVSVCVDDGEYPFRAVVVNGEAQVSEPTGTDHEAQKKLVDHFYGPDMWAEWVTTPRAREIRIRLTVVPKKWMWWDQRRKLKGSVSID